MFRFFLSLGAACGNVRPSAPDGRHDAQLLGDFLERSVLREPLESVHHGLLIGHGLDSTASQRPLQEARSSVARSSEVEAFSGRLGRQVTASMTFNFRLSTVDFSLRDRIRRHSCFAVSPLRVKAYYRRVARRVTADAPPACAASAACLWRLALP